MDSDEEKCYEDFLAYLFRENIEPKILHFMNDSLSSPQPKYVNPGGQDPSASSTSEPTFYPSDSDVRREMAYWKTPIVAMQAMSTINHINYHCPTDQDIYFVFTKEGLLRTLHDIIYTVQIAKVAAERTGYLDVIDDNFLPIFNGLKIERLPPHEREVLRNMGSKDPEAELCAMLQTLVSRKELIHSETQQMESSQVLTSSVAKLEESKAKLDQQPERISYEHSTGLPNKRKWGVFGLILKGASLIVPNIVSAAIPFFSPVHVDASQALKAGFQSIGSVQLGVETVREGYKKL